MTITKSDVVSHLAEKAGVTKGKADEVLGALTDLIHVELRSGRDFVLPEIGRLHVVKKAARHGKAPAAFGGEAWSSPEGKSVKIKVAKVLSDAVA